MYEKWGVITQTLELLFWIFEKIILEGPGTLRMSWRNFKSVTLINWEF